MVRRLLAKKTKRGNFLNHAALFYAKHPRPKRTSCHFLFGQQAAPRTARQVFAERLAGFRQKTRPKKWQGGHLLGAFRHSAFAPAASLAPMRSLSPVAASGVAPIPAVP